MTAEDLDRITQDWCGGDWTTLVYGISRPSTPPDDKTTKALCSRIDSHLQKGQTGRAYNWSLLALHLSGGAIMADRRFIELFEPGSKPVQTRRVARKILARLELSGMATTSMTTPRAVASWRTYLDVSLALEPLRRGLVERIRADPQTLHAAVVELEDAFSREEAIPAEELNKTTVADLRREELAEAVSYLIAQAAHHGVLKVGAFFRFTTSNPLTREREQMIVDAYRLRQLHEAEPAVSRLGYRCERMLDGTYALRPPDDEFGMALSFGYLKTALMADASPPEWGGTEAGTFREMCDQAVKRIGPRFLRVVTQPFKRLVIEMPEPKLRKIGEDFLLTKGLYREDVWQLDRACYEMGVTADDLEAFEVAPALSLMDVVVISRVFRFLFLFRLPTLKTLGETDRIAYLNSVLPASTRSEYVSLLTAAGVATNKAEAFIELFTWSVSQDRTLDLQYTPIIDLGYDARPLLAVFAGSNGIRNALVTAKKRVHHDGTVDPVTSRVLEALTARTPMAWLNVKYDAATGRGEIDVFAVLGDRVFAFECKATILPCSEFEQRTLYDYLSKAAKQLDRFRALFADEHFRGALSERLEIALPSADVLTTIVLSNRLLSGATFRGHAVRHVHELGNILESGAGSIEMGGSRYVLSLWRGHPFDAEILVDYLDPHNATLYAAVWAAFVRSDEALDIGPIAVRRARYGVVPEILLEQLRLAGFIAGAM